MISDHFLLSRNCVWNRAPFDTYSNLQWFPCRIFRLWFQKMFLFIFGPFLVHICSIFSPYLVHFWSIFGPLLIHFRPIFGPFSIHFWSIFDQLLVNFLVNFCQWVKVCWEALTLLSNERKELLSKLILVKKTTITSQFYRILYGIHYAPLYSAFYEGAWKMMDF